MWIESVLVNQVRIRMHDSFQTGLSTVASQVGIQCWQRKRELAGSFLISSIQMWNVFRIHIFWLNARTIVSCDVFSFNYFFLSFLKKDHSQ